jgi:hypothetical protein
MKKNNKSMLDVDDDDDNRSNLYKRRFYAKSKIKTKTKKEIFCMTGRKFPNTPKKNFFSFKKFFSSKRILFSKKYTFFF